MRLVYLTSMDKLPGKRIERSFDGHVEVIEVPRYEQMGRVQHTEEIMRERGISEHGIDDFLLYPPRLQHLGDVVARNMLNAGVISEDGETLLGDTRIELRRAMSCPLRGIRMFS